MSVSIKYKGSEILNIPSGGDYKLNTSGKYLEDDIRITDSGGGSDIGAVWQDAQGYVHLSDEGDSPPTLITKNITVNGTYNASSDSADGYSSVTVNVSGGASNFVQGTFVAGTAGTVQTINIPYTGSGYPISVTIAVNGGTYVNGSGNVSAQTWYDAVHQSAIGEYTLTKCGTTNIPQYEGSNVFIDGSTVYSAYKSSSTNNTVYTRGFNIGQLTYKSADPTASSTNAVTIPSATSLKIMISGASSGYGFLSGLTYSYYIVYSS